MYERFTDDARKVMQLANQEALQLRHSYCATDHILLALLSKKNTNASKILEGLYFNTEGACRAIRSLNPPGNEDHISSKLPKTPRAKILIELAEEKARDLNSRCVDTEHILLAMVIQEEGIAEMIIRFIGKNDFGRRFAQNESIYQLKQEAIRLIGEEIAKLDFGY